MGSFFTTPVSVPAVINRDTGQCLEITYGGVDYVVYKQWNDVVEANPRRSGEYDDHVERFIGKWVPEKRIIHFY